MTGHVRHLYVHLPFCGHRCGYCDFVTVVGRLGQHERYVDALLAELELERRVLAPLETVFLGGGTPTFTEPAALRRVLRGLPAADEVTVEANPETVTPQLAALLREHGVTRVSLGAQSFQPHLLATLERRAGPDDVRRAFYHLRDAGFDNISLDLIYGIPGQGPSDLDADIDEALALRPEHLSCYELEAKSGTRFAHAHGAELARQAEAMEGYFEAVVDGLTAAGYRWYETANFCRPAKVAAGRDLRSRHNLAYWLGRDYLGIGIGAVSTVAGRRWRNTPRLPAYLGALGRAAAPPREVEGLDAEVQGRERVMLGLRLDEPFDLNGEESLVDQSALERLSRLGLLTRTGCAIALTHRGRLLGGGVTAELLA
jgi:oxygen-independent coproporphyrinogen III oxidase